MIDKKNFEKIKKEFDFFEEKRETAVRKSRDITTLSKQLIYSLHRQDFVNAGHLHQQIKAEVQQLKKLIKKEPKLLFSGSAKTAMQEYAEAIALLHFLKKKKLLPYSKEFLDHEYYLLGLCDLTGELVRLAVNASIRKEFSLVVKIREFVDELYHHMAHLDLRNSDLRRKFDGIKYDLKKLDDFVYDLHVKRIR